MCKNSNDCCDSNNKHSIDPKKNKLLSNIKNAYDEFWMKQWTSGQKNIDCKEKTPDPCISPCKSSAEETSNTIADKLRSVKNLASKNKLLAKFGNAYDVEWLKNWMRGKLQELNLQEKKKQLKTNVSSIPDLIKNFDFKAAFEGIKGNITKMSEGSGAPSRPMKFPYTFSAKIAQFPVKFYVQNQWIWKYYAVSFAICLPVFYSIHKLANSPGNVAKWADIKRKELEEHHH